MKKIIIALIIIFMLPEYSIGQHLIYKKDVSAISEREAILVLPGLEGNKKRRKKILTAFEYKGYDVFVLDYIDRNSLTNTRKYVEDYIYDNKLDKYKELHCFTYIMGTWTLNDFIQKNGFINIKTIISDRSPPQELAPRIAKEKLNWIAKIVKGKIVFDLADTPYPVIDNPENVNFGIIIENKATKLVKMYKKTALSYGPISMDVNALNQSYDDYFYVLLDHYEMYSNFDIIGEPIHQFLKNGVFPQNSQREPITNNLFAK